MRKATLLVAAIAIAVLIPTCAQAAERIVTRAYLMRGLAGLILSPFTGMDAIGAKLRARGVVVMVGHWWEWGRFVADAARHPNDRIIFSGHSMGAWAAGKAADALPKSNRVRVVGLDPLCTFASVRKGTDAVNFTRGIYLACGNHGLMLNAKNISLAAYGDSHIGIVADPRAQARVVSAVLSH